MFGSHRPKGTIASLVLMFASIGIMAFAMPDKAVSPLWAIALTLGVLTVIALEMLLFCYMHYNETPKQTWHRIRRDN